MIKVINSDPSILARAVLSIEPLKLNGYKGTICLTGDLAAGKTRLTQEICSILGTRANVSSPTFSVHNIYDAADGLTINHLDLYRIKTAEELLYIGLDEILDFDSLNIIEWADLFADHMPDQAIWINLEFDGGIRTAALPEPLCCEGLKLVE